eukprot:jgi/Chrzof1/4172/Cz14g01200.t1_PGM3[v5.2]
MDLHNMYWILRHGRSKANEAQVIVSSLENGVKPQYGLSDAGNQQAAQAGQQLHQQLATLGMSQLHIYSSPFSRTMETAYIVAEALGMPRESVVVTEALRERYFGKELEQCSHDNYCPAWATDAVDVTSQPGGDGESVLSLSHRIRGLFQELETQHQGQHILLVSHGDTLSILQATVLGAPLGQHRDYGLQTAQLQQLKTAGQCSNSPLQPAATN